MRGYRSCKVCPNLFSARGAEIKCKGEYKRKKPTQPQQDLPRLLRRNVSEKRLPILIYMKGDRIMVLHCGGKR